jgi:hypothetical protein
MSIETFEKHPPANTGSISLSQPSDPQVPTTCATASNTATGSFPLLKKLLSILIWLTLLIPAVAFFHMEITGAPSRIWLLLTWQDAAPPGQPAPIQNFQQISQSVPSPVKNPIPIIPHAGAPAKPDSQVPDTMPIVDPSAPIHVPLKPEPAFNWAEFIAEITSLIRGESLDAKIETALIANVEWMANERWQPEFIRRFVDLSLQMETAGVFFSLPKCLRPNKWFLVPRAHERNIKCMRQQLAAPEAPLGKMGLWKLKHQKALNKCDAAYAKFLEDRNLNEIEQKLMSNYAMAGWNKKADEDLFNWLAADIIYSPGMKFRFQKPYTPDAIAAALDKLSVTRDQALSVLAGKYAHAQGMLRHMEKFPGRDGDVVSVYRRLWPCETIPSGIGERYRPLFAKPMWESELPLKEWDTQREALYKAHPALISKDGTLLGEDGSFAKFSISPSDNYPVQSFSVAAPGQKETGQLPGHSESVEKKSFGCCTSETKIPVYAVLEPSCFIEKGVPIERELILLATKYMAQISLFKHNQTYNEEVVGKLYQQYPYMDFKTVQCA